MSFERIGVVTDNMELAEFLLGEVSLQKLGVEKFSFHCSPGSEQYLQGARLTQLDVRDEKKAEQYDLLLSIHCRQIFPAGLVRRVRCINLHPGLNPYNRGWYPQVFSLINGLPSGATFHEMDERIDHGRIIDQISVPLTDWDTSGSAYRKVIDAEKNLIRSCIAAIVSGTYGVQKTGHDEGNYNSKNDFAQLCRIDLESVGTFREHINHLRALTHEGFSNAHFKSTSGRRIYLRLELMPDPK
jgi:methionyl-tRNA formyltransferase